MTSEKDLITQHGRTQEKPVAVNARSRKTMGFATERVLGALYREQSNLGREIYKKTRTTTGQRLCKKAKGRVQCGAYKQEKWAVML